MLGDLYEAKAKSDLTKTQNSSKVTNEQKKFVLAFKNENQCKEGI